MNVRTLLLSAPFALLAACGGSTDAVETPDTGQLVVRASGSATAPALLPAGQSLAVAAASFELGFAEMRLSANVNCSGPYQTVFSRTTPTRVDLVGNPEIARSDGLARGTYPCVAMRLSDLLRYRPATSEGPCVAGVLRTHDIYRTDNEEVAWRDVAGAALTARGTLTSPVEDLVWVFISRDPAAVVARGYSVNQAIPLASSLVVPGTTTFYWDLSSALGDEGGFCGTVGGQIGFR